MMDLFRRRAMLMNSTVNTKAKGIFATLDGAGTPKINRIIVTCPEITVSAQQSSGQGTITFTLNHAGKSYISLNSGHRGIIHSNGIDFSFPTRQCVELNGTAEKAWWPTLWDSLGTHTLLANASWNNVSSAYFLLPAGNYYWRLGKEGTGTLNNYNDNGAYLARYAINSSTKGGFAYPVNLTGGPYGTGVGLDHVEIAPKKDMLYQNFRIYFFIFNETTMSTHTIQVPVDIPASGTTFSGDLDITDYVDLDMYQGQNTLWLNGFYPLTVEYTTSG